MGYKTVESVMQRSHSKGAARLLLMVLATHADDDTLECYPGRQLLCEETAMGERNLIYALKQLEDLGEVRVKRGVGRGHGSHYLIALPNPKKVQNLVKEKGAKFGNSTAKRVQDLVDKRCKISLEKVQDLVAKGAKSGYTYKEEPSRTIIEPSIEHTCEREPEIVDAVAVWESVFGQQLGIFEGERIREAAIADLEVWRDTLKMWWTNQYSRRNLTRIFEVYQEKLAAKKEGNGNGKTHHEQRSVQPRETHNAKAARETAEWIASAFTETGGDSSADSEDPGTEGIAVDFRRL